MTKTIATNGWTTVPTNYGDTLASIAMRELGDASRWPELALLNNLLPPYITENSDDPRIAAGRVILMGSVIRVPASSSVRQEISPVESFGIDVNLKNGMLSIENGDLVLVSGTQNLRQALEMRLKNEMGCLPFHPNYGNYTPKLIGERVDDTHLMLSLRFCEECLLGDPRVVSVQDGISTASGDAIKVAVTAVVNDGTPLRLQVEI